MDESYLLTIENYYKTLNNVLDFKDNADLFLNKHVESQVLQGKGYYNVYNHKNIYALFIRQNEEWFLENKAYAMYLFGIVPTITYNFSF